MLRWIPVHSWRYSRSGVTSASGNLATYVQDDSGAQHSVVVFVNDDATLIMPDQTVPMGRMRQGEGFLVKTTYRNSKPVYEVSRA